MLSLHFSSCLVYLFVYLPFQFSFCLINLSVSHSTKQLVCFNHRLISLVFCFKKMLKKTQKNNGYHDSVIHKQVTAGSKL